MFRVVIPARFGSTRLPGKPLLNIAGRPMLQWVHERASSSGAQQVIIATDDDRIAAVARGFGALVRMTSLTHVSGTDRIAEVAHIEGWEPFDIVVNVQGDEPLLPPQLIDQVAALLHAHADAAIATLATPIISLASLLDPNVVKVVTDLQQRALLFSRAPIPWSRDTAPGGMASQRSYAGARRHLGIYAYRVSALQRIGSLRPTQLEQIEKLEQLRALENGMDIRVADASVLPGPDVNTAEDLARAAAVLTAGSMSP
ncbi:MAG: 3-deoxy-manno-octulosonate cytidylyltransferase [Steroidobacteraceae bacterium]